MNIKLPLNPNQEIIEKAKVHASNKKCVYRGLCNPIFNLSHLRMLATNLKSHLLLNLWLPERKYMLIWITKKSILII